MIDEASGVVITTKHPTEAVSLIFSKFLFQSRLTSYFPGLHYLVTTLQLRGKPNWGLSHLYSMRFLPANQRCRAGSTLAVVGVLIFAVISAAFIFLLVAGRYAVMEHPRNKAANLASQFKTAIECYRVEYGVYPVPKGTGNVDFYVSSTDAATWKALIIALCALDPVTGKEVDLSKASIPNDRHIPFLSLRADDLDSRSGTLKHFPDFDGMPQSFNLAMDSNSDGHVGDKDGPAGKIPDPVTGRPGAVIEQGVCIWSGTPPPSGIHTY